MLNKIRFAFTGVFLKLQNVIRNLVHFNTFGGGYTWGGGGGASNRMYFLCTVQRAYNWEGAYKWRERGGREAYKQQVTVLCKCTVSLPA